MRCSSSVCLPFSSGDIRRINDFEISVSFAAKIAAASSKLLILSVFPISFLFIYPAQIKSALAIAKNNPEAANKHVKFL